MGQFPLEQGSWEGAPRLTLFELLSNHLSRQSNETWADLGWGPDSMFETKKMSSIRKDLQALFWLTTGEQ